MEYTDPKIPGSRRTFLATLATGAAAMSLAGFATPLEAFAKTDHQQARGLEGPDAPFQEIKGKHRIVFDITEPNQLLPFAWPLVFLIANGMAGTPEKDNGVVVVLRHEAIPYAMDSSLWSKYNFNELFKIHHQKTNTSAMHNTFYKPAPGGSQVAGIGPVTIGVNELQESGVMFCVCNIAMTVYSALAAQVMNMKNEDVYAAFKAGVLPGIRIVPSGVWAIGRAQEHGCAYCKV